MMPFFHGALYPSKNLIGIDAGAYSTKIVWLKGGGAGSYRLKSAFYARSPADKNAGFLRAIANAQRLTGKKVATVLYGPELLVRRITLPPMPDKDLREAVKWEIRKESAIPADELVCDYVVPDDKASEGLLSIIAFAARRGAVDGIMSEFKSAGVEVRVVETVPTALLSSFDANNVWEEGVNYAFIDIGLTASTLAIFKNRKLVFVREMAFGGAEITGALSSETGKNEDECDEIKASCSLEKGVAPFAVVAKFIERLCSDIHRSFEYYQAQYRGGQVDRLFLSGGTARMKHIDGFMTETLGIPAFADDPLRKTKGVLPPLGVSPSSTEE
ncbi:MAG: pilus assembly protein PilM, partial [Deltaproteobacteria bacterium]|nr:pilus assembly protein PilM [Deltaproteobacteria bacterium]